MINERIENVASPTIEPTRVRSLEEASELVGDRDIVLLDLDNSAAIKNIFQRGIESLCQLPYKFIVTNRTNSLLERFWPKRTPEMIRRLDTLGFETILHQDRQNPPIARRLHLLFRDNEKFFRLVDNIAEIINNDGAIQSITLIADQDWLRFIASAIAFRAKETYYLHDIYHALQQKGIDLSNIKLRFIEIFRPRRNDIFLEM